MLSQWNTPTVLPWRVNSTVDQPTDFGSQSVLMCQWEHLVLVLVCLRSKSSIIGSASVVGRSVLSSEKLCIELMRFHAVVVLCCRLCRFYHESHVANLHKTAKEQGCPGRETTIQDRC